MATSYRYRASTVEGEMVQGVVRAASRDSAVSELRRQRLYPVELAPAGAGAGTGRKRAAGRHAALALFTRTLATMLEAGVPLDRGLAFAAAGARHPALAEAARQVHHDLLGGAGLAEAAARHPDVFGPLFVAMAAAGEEGGALDESLASLADHLDEVVELRSRIRSSLLYPALMAVTSGIGTAVLLLFVVPRFVAMLDEAGGTLPLSTRLLVGGSALVVQAWWLLLIVAALAALGGRAWLAQPGNAVRWHAWRLGLPLSGELELKYATARFARVLGMLLRSGRPMLASLRVARGAVPNLQVAEGLERAAEAVRHGSRLDQALAGTLPPLALELIAVGEEAGRLDDLCLRVAQAYDDEVRRTLRTLVAVIEPALILIFGVVVAFIALAMLQAIYGLNSGLL